MTPVGHVPLPAADDSPLASAWRVEELGKKNKARVDPLTYVRSAGLPPPQQIAFGSVSVQFFPNAMNRLRNEAQQVENARLRGGTAHQHGLLGVRLPLPGCSPRPGGATQPCITL